MIMRGLITAALVLAAGLSGCAHSQNPRGQKRLPYFVPTAAIVQIPGYETRAQPSQVLPASDGDYYIARGERMAVGNTPLDQYTSYSIYTYDAQAIAVPESGFGYRYRWIYQQGTAALPQ